MRTVPKMGAGYFIALFACRRAIESGATGRDRPGGFSRGDVRKKWWGRGHSSLFAQPKIGPIDGLLDTPSVGHHGKPKLRDTVAVDFFTVPRC